MRKKKKMRKIVIINPRDVASEQQAGMELPSLEVNTPGTHSRLSQQEALAMTNQ